MVAIEVGARRVRDHHAFGVDRVIRSGSHLRLDLEPDLSALSDHVEALVVAGSDLD